MSTGNRIARAGHIDIAGGGQVWVDGTTLYVGHMSAPHGTTIVDIADPSAPRVLATIAMPAGWHSHKVRVANGVMIVNHERLSADADPSFRGGLGIYDVTDPAKPALLANWETAGSGVHRFSFDGRYAYISPTVEGYSGNITMILDLADPAHPVEVGRWWLPGQWTAGGEHVDATNDRGPRCHHPLRLGDRLYVSYWQHGGAILDISDMTKPTTIARIDTTASFPHPTHTLLAIPEPLKGRRVMVVADEDVDKRWPAAPAFLWIYDITNESAPVPISTFQVAGLDPDGAPQPKMTGCHQPSERFHGSIVPCALVCPGPAYPRHRRSVRSARDRVVRSRSAGRLRARIIERRHDRRSRLTLSRRSPRRHRHLGNLGLVTARLRSSRARRGIATPRAFALVT